MFLKTVLWFFTPWCFATCRYYCHLFLFTPGCKRKSEFLSHGKT